MSNDSNRMNDDLRKRGLLLDWAVAAFWKYAAQTKDGENVKRVLRDFEEDENLVWNEIKAAILGDMQYMAEDLAYAFHAIASAIAADRRKWVVDPAERLRGELQPDSEKRIELADILVDIMDKAGTGVARRYFSNEKENDQ